MTKEKVYQRFRQHKQFTKVARLLVNQGNTEKALELAERLTTNAMVNYPGFYSDGEIEELLHNIAQKELTPVNSRSNNSVTEKKCCLHIITNTYEVGGHTRLLKQWVMADRIHDHQIILTGKRYTAADYFEDIPFTEIDNTLNTLEKAAVLRKKTEEADFILLHHAANDVVSALALATESIKAPVAILNHADHISWIGSSLCDYLIEIREGYLTLDKGRRQVLNGGYLPIPVQPMTAINTKESRRKLGLSEKQVMLLTIASAYKLESIGHWHFLNDITEVLEQNPHAVLYVVGMSQNHVAAFKHPQIVFVGETPETDLYKSACDIYVESFPFASFTSLLETVINNKAVQLMYNPPLLSKMLSNEADDKLIWNYPTDKKQWASQLSQLISDDSYRTKKAARLSQLINEKHNLNWSKYLAKIYGDMQSLSHSVRKIKPASFYFTQEEAVLCHLLKNNFKAASAYSMIAISLKTRLKVFAGWLWNFLSFKKDDFVFLYRFVKGKHPTV